MASAIAALMLTSSPTAVWADGEMINGDELFPTVNPAGGRDRRTISVRPGRNIMETGQTGPRHDLYESRTQNSLVYYYLWDSFRKNIKISVEPSDQCAMDIEWGGWVTLPQTGYKGYYFGGGLMWHKNCQSWSVGNTPKSFRYEFGEDPPSFMRFPYPSLWFGVTGDGVNSTHSAYEARSVRVTVTSLPRSCTEDAAADVIFANSGNGRIYIAKTSGGDWLPGSELPVNAGGPLGQFGVRYFAEDFDGDGYVDLGGWNVYDTSFYVGLNDGRGNFNKAGSGYWISPNTFGDNGNTLVAADFTGDGKADLGSWEDGDSSFHVTVSTGTGFWGQGTGRWIHPGWMGGAENRQFFVGDFNRDGYADLMARRTDYSFHINFSTGSGFWAYPTGQWLAGGILDYRSAFHVGDFDGDGASDLGAWNFETRTFRVFKSASYTFDSGSDWLTLDYAGQVQTGDFDGDGREDFGIRRGDKVLRIHHAQPEGRFARFETILRGAPDFPGFQANGTFLIGKARPAR